MQCVGRIQVCGLGDVQYMIEPSLITSQSYVSYIDSSWTRLGSLPAPLITKEKDMPGSRKRMMIDGSSISVRPKQTESWFK